MDEELMDCIIAKLKALGYTDVEGNCGTVWYTDKDGQTWFLNPMPCEVGEFS